jgi:hypothetical protein
MDYTIQKLFKEAFGVNVSGIYMPSTSKGAQAPKEGLYNGIEVTEDVAEAIRKSHLGTPILFPVTFLGGSYQKYNFKGEIERVNYSDFELPASCIIDFSRAKNMSTTKLSGSYTTVKEIYGFDDWQITINGFFLPDPAQPQGFFKPLDQEKELVKWDELACAIDVLCPLFADKNISSISIHSLDIKALRGQPNIRPFSIRATSDEPIELNIKSDVTQ